MTADQPRPHWRTVALLDWIFGNLDTVRRPRLTNALLIGSGLTIGWLTVVLLPPWAMGVVLLVSLAGVAWLLRVVKAYDGIRP